MIAQDYLSESAAKVETIDHFKQWIGQDIKPIFPHEAFACGHGRIHAAGVATDYILTIDFPVTHLGAICNLAGGIDTPLMRRWMKYREPQIFNANSLPDWPEISSLWIQEFLQQDLRNAAVHAIFDEERYLGSYFSFHRLPQAPGADEIEILKNIAPLMHETLVRVIQQIENAEQQKCPAWERLTQREMEMLQWITRGMSNGEIAAHMSVSENTVKHHITSIFEKTNLTNRAGLMAALTTYPPGRVLKGTKIF